MDHTSAHLDLDTTQLLPQEFAPATPHSRIWPMFWAGLASFVALLGITLANVLPITPRIAEQQAPPTTHLTTELREQMNALRHEISELNALQRTIAQQNARTAGITRTSFLADRGINPGE